MPLEIYADGSDFDTMIDLYNNNKSITGFTTNPSLMRKSGVIDYLGFVNKVTSVIKDLPISFEVVADNHSEMKAQALKLSSYGDNVYVKIPIVYTNGRSTEDLIDELWREGVKINVTAVMTVDQIKNIMPYLQKSKRSIISIFAGRIADTGTNPASIIAKAVNLAPFNVRVLWASPREVYNVYEAEELGCDIITLPLDLIKKLQLKGLDLSEYSRQTAEMFINDAVASGYTI